MAINMLQLPSYHPGNALDFSSINGAIDTYQKQNQLNTQNKLAQAQLGMQQDRLGMEKERFGFEKAQAKRQQGIEAMRTFAGHAQGIEKMTDPAQRSAAWTRLLASHPDAANLPEIYRDPINGPRLALQEAQGFMGQKDQAQIGLIKGQTAAAYAQAEKARREAAEAGDSYGREIKPYQTPDGKIWGVQAGSRGNTIFHNLSEPGAPPIVVPRGGLPPGAVAQPGGPQGTPQPQATRPGPAAPGQPLTPYAPRKVVGDRVFNPGTGGFEGSARDAIAGGEQAKAEGGELGKLRSSLPKQRLKMRLFDDKSTRAISTIDKAIGIIGSNTAGYGALLKGLPAAQARQLEGYLNTIKANVTFEELQAMREASPTGGALGQVSNFENELLSSVRAAIDQLQKGENLRENLMVIRDSMEKIRRIKADAFAEDEARAYGEAPITGIRQSQGGQDMPRPSSPEEAARLPRGTRFVAPDGSIRTVP